MDLFDTMAGLCEVRQRNVEILMVKLKKAKTKDGALTPVRCMSAGDCPRGSFCRFVNPLTTRIPVIFENRPVKPEKPAAAS